MLLRSLPVKVVWNWFEVVSLFVVLVFVSVSVFVSVFVSVSVSDSVFVLLLMFVESVGCV